MEHEFEEDHVHVRNRIGVVQGDEGTRVTLAIPLTETEEGDHMVISPDVFKILMREVLREVTRTSLDRFTVKPHANLSKHEDHWKVSVDFYRG